MIKKDIKQALYIGSFLFISAITCVSCASTGKTGGKNKITKTASSDYVDPLSAKERRKYDYFFLEATRMKEKGNYDAAFELYNHCLQIDPNAASALYEISQFYLYLKQADKGLAALKEAVRMDPDNFWYKQTLAASYLTKGDIKNTIDVYEAMVFQFPSRHESLIVLVDLYKRQGDYPKVINTLDRLEAKEGKSEQITMEKFRIYLTSGDSDKAFKEIESLAKEYPHDMRYLSILGDVYMNNGKMKEAYDTYKKVLETEPDNTMTLLSLANYYNKTDQPELYRQQLDTILVNNKIDSSAKLDIMRQLIIQSEQADRDSIKIIDMFDKILLEEQKDAQIPMLYVQYLLSKGMEEESIPVLHRILDIDPENNAARLQLLSYALRETNFEEVIKLCESGILYSPETLEYYYYLGLAYYQLDRKDDALRVYLDGIEHTTAETPKNLLAGFYSIMGEIYHTKGQKEKAFQAYENALTANPDDIMTLNNYAYYLSVERVDLDKAEEMSYKTIKAEPTNGTFLDTYAWILFEKKRYAEAKIYIDQALKNGGEESEVVVEHAGDVYFMDGEKEKAMEYWLKAQEMGNESKTLKQKIKQKKYIPE